MNPKPLSQDLTDALHAAIDEPLAVIDPSNQHIYFFVDQQVHDRAMKALRHQENVDSTWCRGQGGGQWYDIAGIETTH